MLVFLIYLYYICKTNKQKTEKMKKLSINKLNELKDRFWKRNKHNSKGEIELPLFFNELQKRITTN